MTSQDTPHRLRAADRPLATSDPSTPSVARMYDYMLGGKDNYVIDRERVEEVQIADPHAVMVINESRRFLRRAVRFMAAECGIRQFLDIGTGLPTQENVHHVAQAVHPDAKVVYVDNDPVVLAYGRALLDENDRTTVVRADLRDPDSIIYDPDVRSLLDFSEPIGLLTICTMHFVMDDDDPDYALGRLRNALAPGSCMALSHAVTDVRPEAVARVAEVYQRVNTPATVRPRERIAGFFGDFELVEPGLVPAPHWRPDGPLREDQAELVWILSGVGRKPGEPE